MCRTSRAPHGDLVATNAAVTSDAVEHDHMALRAVGERHALELPEHARRESSTELREADRRDLVPVDDHDYRPAFTVTFCALPTTTAVR